MRTDCEVPGCARLRISCDLQRFLAYIATSLNWRFSCLPPSTCRWESNACAQQQQNSGETSRFVRSTKKDTKSEGSQMPLVTYSLSLCQLRRNLFAALRKQRTSLCPIRGKCLKAQRLSLYFVSLAVQLFRPQVIIGVRSDFCLILASTFTASSLRLAFLAA